MLHIIGGYPINYFEKIKDLSIGDEIIYTTPYGEKTYEVIKYEVIKEVSKIATVCAGGIITSTQADYAFRYGAKLFASPIFNKPLWVSLLISKIYINLNSNAGVNNLFIFSLLYHATIFYNNV